MTPEEWEVNSRRVLVWGGLLCEEFDPLDEDLLLVEQLLDWLPEGGEIELGELLKRVAS